MTPMMEKQDSSSSLPCLLERACKESDDPYSTFQVSPRPAYKNMSRMLFYSGRADPLDNEAINGRCKLWSSIYTMHYNTFYSPEYYSYYFNGTSDQHSGHRGMTHDRNNFQKFLRDGAFIMKIAGDRNGATAVFLCIYYDSRR